MGYSFSINTNNADTIAFTNMMDAAWYNPTYQGNVDLKFVDIPVTLGMLQSTYGEQRAPLNGYDMSNAVNFTPGQFGLAMNAAFGDSSIWSDGTLSNYDIGLSAFLQQQYASDFFKLNPFTEGFGNSFNWTFSLGDAFNFDGIGGGSSVVSANDPYKEQNSDKAKFDRKVRLVSEIGDYDEEIEKIKKAIGTDYKKGIIEIDKLIKKIDSEELHEAAKSIYEEDFEATQENAANIANNWVTQIENQGLDPNFKVNMSGVTKDNILDVLGNFLTNEKVKSNAVTWNTLIENNFKEISKVLIEKAKEMKKGADDATKTSIDNAIKQVKDAKNSDDVNTKITSIYTLFSTLRGMQTKASDNGAFSRYGIPQDKINANEKTEVAQNKFKEEAKAYKEQQDFIKKHPNLDKQA